MKEEELLLLLLQVAAGCCLLLHCVAESNKPKSGKAALVCPLPQYLGLPSASFPLSVLPHLMGSIANKGVARAVKMSNYFAKMLHNSRVLCHQLPPPPFYPLLPLPASISALSSRLSCCQSSRCATCPRNVAYAIWKLIA